MKIRDTKRYIYALTGYPLGHSMSPFIHKALFEISKIEASYGLVETPPEDLGDSFKNTLSALRGFNVTIPHKTAVIKYLDELSPRAELFGAVNTVDVREDKIVGHNTDCAGFLSALQSADIELGGDVLLLGSGGVARMIAFESVLADANLTIAVRESGVPKAEKIKKEIKQKVIQSSKAAFDVIYNPYETVFIKYAKQAGIKYSGGLSMLVWQAAVAQEIWNGVKFSNEDIDKVIDLTQKELEKNE